MTTQSGTFTSNFCIFFCFFYHLLSEPCGEQPYERQRRPTDCRLPAAEAVGEHADHGRTEEDHAHGQSADPSCGGIKNLQSEASGNLI